MSNPSQQARLAGTNLGESSPGLRAVILVMALASPGAAGSTWLLVGPGFGGFRKPPRRGYASLEMNHFPDDSRFGLWASDDLPMGDGEFLGAGPCYRWPVGQTWEMSLGTGPGWYCRQSGPDLGDPLEFRSTFYVSHQFRSGSWCGASVTHLSNAGLSRHNPGTESLRVFWVIPLAWR